ncbi:hypothetical protein KEJ39_00485 [Candidatus Bathyarchaeota archaeon]|nr:hypothetical protein [Candidatus Bathyarchaeota archaeon]
MLEGIVHINAGMAALNAALRVGHIFAFRGGLHFMTKAEAIVRREKLDDVETTL